MDPVKEAFTRAKQDIFELQNKLFSLEKELVEIKSLLKAQTSTPAQNPEFQTNNTLSDNNPADKLPFKALISQNSTISTRNEGVPADKQTDKQTDNSTRNEGVFQSKTLFNSLNSLNKEASTILRKLTHQELVVLSSIYQLSEEELIVDYSILAERLKLTESSIRDYTQRIIKKGIPIEKLKENNKRVYLSLNPSFKKLVSLSTLLTLQTTKIHLLH